MIQRFRFDLAIVFANYVRVLKGFRSDRSMIGCYRGQEFIPSI